MVKVNVDSCNSRLYMFYTYMLNMALWPLKHALRTGDVDLHVSIYDVQMQKNATYLPNSTASW